MPHTMEQIYGEDLFSKPCPPWPGYPGEGNPGGLAMIRDEQHPCHGCPMELEHLVPGRVHIPGHDEAGTPPPAPFNPIYAWPPPSATPYRAACINDELFFAVQGAITASGISNNFDGMGNLFNSEVLSGVVVASSGKTLTVKSEKNPFDLLITRYEFNPDYDGVDPEEPFIVNRGIRTRVQTGDIVGFIHSFAASKIVCRVDRVVSSEWGGPNSTWQLTVTQNVNSASKPLLPLFQQAEFGITREAVAPRNWQEFRDGAPLYVARIEGRRITYADMLAAPEPPRVELLDTGGQPCRIALPEAPNPLLGFLGTFQAIKKSAGGGSLDVTPAVQATLRIEHVPGGYRTTIDASAALSAEGDELALLYEPEWRAADGAKAKRSSCQAICHHSHYHPKMGWGCGLAGDRILNQADDNNPADNPPSGLANYREGADQGCYQPGACDRFQARVPWTYQADFEAFIRSINNGYVAREEQTFPGSQSPSNFTTKRPFFPSGTPGLGSMAGRNARSPDGYHATKRLIPDGAFYVWTTGSNGGRVIRHGAEIELTDGVRIWDLSAGEKPKPGLFNNRTDGGAQDALGRPFNNDNDPNFALRDAGGRLPSCSTTDSGQAAGFGEGDSQSSIARTPMLPRVSLGTGAAGSTQSAAHGGLSAYLDVDDSLLLVASPLGLRDDNGYGKAAKRAGVVAAASDEGGGIVKIQIANAYRNCTKVVHQGEVVTRHLTGGHFCPPSDGYQTYDPNDGEGKVEAANSYRGPIPGESCLVPFAAPGFFDRGFYVEKAAFYAGDSEPWGPSNPAPPVGWIGEPKNYAAWGHKRDVVWLRDSEDGLLAANLGNLPGQSIVCVVGGIISPEGDLKVFRSEYEGGWVEVDPADIQSVDRWRGRVTLKPSYVQSLDRTVQHCFRLECRLCDRRRPPAAFHFREIVRKQSKLIRIKGVIASGADAKIYSASQAENPFANEWGMNQRAIVNAEMFSNQNTLLDTEPRPDLLVGLGEECLEGYYAEGEAILRTAVQQPGTERNVFSVGVTPGSPSVSFRRLNRASEMRLASFTGVELGKPSWPAGTEILAASCQFRGYGLKHQKYLNEFVPDGMGGWTFTPTELANTEGAAQLKLGLYGYKVDPQTGETFPVLVGSGGTFTGTDGEWRTADVTELAKQALNFKDSEYIAFGIVPIPTLVDIAADSNIGESLAASLPQVEFAAYQPLYSGCGGGPPETPILNPNVGLREGSWESEQIEWGDFQATDLVYTVSWPTNFGKDILVLNDSNGHNWPPKI